MRSTLPILALALVAAAPALATEVVPVQHFRSVELRGGGEVTLVPGPVQRVTLLQGSTSYTRVYVDRDGRLKIDACYRQCPRNFRLRIQIETPSIMGLGVNGGGLMTMASGFSRQNEIGVAVNGGGKIDARAVDAASVGAAVNGGGQILVRTNGTLGAAVHGGGEVLYWGNPTVATTIAGGGSVRRGG